MTKQSNIYKGLTPRQINKAIYGNKATQSVESYLIQKKQSKPEKSFRQSQIGDNSTLLNLPFNTTQTAFLYHATDWFAATQKADVSVIIPIYNNSAKALIESWDAINDGLKVEIIFVDDNCPQNSKDLIIEQFEKRKITNHIRKIYCNAIQQGWSTCCNVGAEKSSANIIVFLDPNTIVAKNWLRSLVQLLNKSEVGIVGGIQIDPEARTFVHAGSEWSWEKGQFLEIGRDIYNGIKLSRPFQINNTPDDLLEPTEREKISSHCMAMRRDQFLDLGGFSPKLNDEEWADADLCLFAKEKGLKVICQGNTRVFRNFAQKSDSYYEQGKLYFHNKWVTSGRIDNLVKNKRLSPRLPIDSIVIRRRAAHGDVLLAASVAPALKKKYPNVKIIFSTDCPEVLQNNPWIDKVVEVYSERWFQLYYDFDMLYEYRPNTNIIATFADAVGVDKKDCDLYLHTEPIENLPESYIVIHAGKTLWAGRNWSSFKFDAISSKLYTAGHKIICVGTDSDHKTSACDLDLRGKTSIAQLGYVIKNAKLFVGIDSFPMHIAQTFEIPGVCFFGSILPSTRLIKDCIKPVFADDLKCLGCHHRKSTPCTITTTCDIGIQDCINTVSIAQVWAIISNLL